MGSKQIKETEFNDPDRLAYKIKNGLLKLIERLEQKREKGDG